MRQETLGKILYEIKKVLALPEYSELEPDNLMQILRKAAASLLSDHFSASVTATTKSRAGYSLLFQQPNLLARFLTKFRSYY